MDSTARKKAPHREESAEELEQRLLRLILHVAATEGVSAAEELIDQAGRIGVTFARRTRGGFR